MSRGRKPRSRPESGARPDSPAGAAAPPPERLPAPSSAPAQGPPSAAGGKTGGRRLRIALGVLLGLVVLSPPIIWLAVRDSGTGPLLVTRERVPSGVTELVLYVPPEAAEDLDGAAGSRTAQVECRDGPGQLVVRAKRPWPFSTDGGALDAHDHLPVSGEQQRRATSCRVAVGAATLEGEVG